MPKERIIDIRELRIGNYLLYDGKIVHVTFLSMDIDDEYEESIGFCELDKTTNEKANWNRALCDKLDRITLTAEWLEKLGFVWAANVHRWAHGSGYRVIQHNYGFDNGIGDGSFAQPPLKHVHQLQNLYFALTCEELTIKELQP